MTKPATLKDLAAYAYTSVSKPGGVRCEACGELVRVAYRHNGGPELCRDDFVACMKEEEREHSHHNENE